MATSGAQLIDALARRVRDTTNFAHSRVFLLDILNRCSYSVNASTRSKVTSVSLTPDPGKTLYATTAIKVIGVRDINGRDLMETPWQSLVLNDPSWLHRIGPQHEMFAQIGRDLLVIYPAVKAADIRALTLRVVTTPTALADDAVAWALPDELVPLLLDLAEVIVLFRGRVFFPSSAMDAPLQRVAEAIGVEVPYRVKRHAEDEK